MVRYFTVLIEGEESKGNLLEQFILKHRGDDSISEEFNDLLAWIKIRMGSIDGAQTRFFRHEKQAMALPPPSRFLEIAYESNLRLYCLRLSDHVVILFNGGIKSDVQTAQECPVVRPHFELAQRLAKAIDKALTEKRIKLVGDGTDLLIERDFELEF